VSLKSILVANDQFLAWHRVQISWQKALDCARFRSLLPIICVHLVLVNLSEAILRFARPSQVTSAEATLDPLFAAQSVTTNVANRRSLRYSGPTLRSAFSRFDRSSLGRPAVRHSLVLILHFLRTVRRWCDSTFKEAVSALGHVSFLRAKDYGAPSPAINAATAMQAAKKCHRDHMGSKIAT
jgi:hypothetical protein